MLVFIQGANISGVDYKRYTQALFFLVSRVDSSFTHYTFMTVISLGQLTLSPPCPTPPLTEAKLVSAH